jgi:hypothetical protein
MTNVSLTLVGNTTHQASVSRVEGKRRWFRVYQRAWSIHRGTMDKCKIKVSIVGEKKKTTTVDVVIVHESKGRSRQNISIVEWRSRADGSVASCRALAWA